MACETHCCVLTRGEFFISDWKFTCPEGQEDFLCSLPTGYKKLGNVGSCAVQITTQILGKENEFNPMEDTCARTSVEGVSINMTLQCASKENLYRALYGVKPALDSGTHSKEYCFETLEECDFFPFEKHEADLENVIVTLKDIAGLEVSTLVVDVDYKLSASGIEINRDDIVLNGAVTITLTYDYDNINSHEIEFLSEYQGYKSIYFKGSNLDNDGEAMFDAHFYKVLFAPIGEFDLITGDAFFTITLTGSVEKDHGSWYKITKKE